MSLDLWSCCPQSPCAHPGRAVGGQGAVLPLPGLHSWPPQLCPAQGPPALGGGMMGGSWAGDHGVTLGSACSLLPSIPGLPLQGGAVSGSCWQPGCSSPHVSSRRVLSPRFCLMSGFSQPYPFMTPFPRLSPHPGTCASLLGAREKPTDLYEPDREGVSGLGEDVKRLCPGCSCPSYGTQRKMQELLSVPAFDPKIIQLEETSQPTWWQVPIIPSALH